MWPFLRQVMFVGLTHAVVVFVKGSMLTVGLSPPQIVPQVALLGVADRATVEAGIWPGERIVGEKVRPLHRVFDGKCRGYRGC